MKKVTFVLKNPLLPRFARVGLTVRHLPHHVLTVQLAPIAQKVQLPLFSAVVDSMQGHKPQFVHSVQPVTTALQIQPCLLYVQQVLILPFSHPVVLNVTQEISV